MKSQTILTPSPMVRKVVLKTTNRLVPLIFVPQRMLNCDQTTAIATKEMRVLVSTALRERTWNGFLSVPAQAQWDVCIGLPLRKSLNGVSSPALWPLILASQVVPKILLCTVLLLPLEASRAVRPTPLVTTALRSNKRSKMLRRRLMSATMTPSTR